MRDVKEAAFAASKFRNGEAHTAISALIEALIRRDSETIVSAESDADMHRIQGAIRRLVELKKLLSITAPE